MTEQIASLQERVESLQHQLNAVQHVLAGYEKKKKPVFIVLDSCIELGESIVRQMKCMNMIDRSGIKMYRFGNGEINAFPSETVRKKDVFIVASGSNVYGLSINDHIMALCSVIRSCRDGSAKFVTVICPYLPYCRSDKKDQGRMPIMGKFICEIFELAGANRMIAIDLHAGQIQGFPNIPLDNIYAINPLVEQIKNDYGECLQDLVIVSPDAGGEKRAIAWASKLGVPETFFTKKRDHAQVSVIQTQDLAKEIDFKNKVVVLIDDIGDTCGTLVGAAKQLMEKGPREVIAIVSHGVFSKNAFDNLNNSIINKIYVTNTIPQLENVERCSKIVVVDLGDLLSQVIVKCMNGESVSELFK